MEQVYVSVFATAVSSVAVFSFGEFLQALKPKLKESAMVAITMNVFMGLRILNDVAQQMSSIHPGKLSMRNFFLRRSFRMPETHVCISGTSRNTGKVKPGDVGLLTKHGYARKRECQQRKLPSEAGVQPAR